MKNTALFITLLFLFASLSTTAQNKFEREHRIRKVQFPEKAISFLENEIERIKRLKYYKEIDDNEERFIAKLKKDRLWYDITFNKAGLLEDVKIVIKTVDIPDEALVLINKSLNSRFKKFKIRKIYQQYLVSKTSNIEETVKNAFQNLLMPTIKYKVLVAGKNLKKSELHEVFFDAEGNFKSIRKSLPPNYDHVLY